MRARNFTAQNEIVERRATSKGRIGKRAYVGINWENAFSGSKTCNFTNDSVSLETDTSQKGKGQSFSTAPDTETRSDGQKAFKRSGSRGQSLWRGKGR